LVPTCLNTNQRLRSSISALRCCSAPCSASIAGVPPAAARCCALLSPLSIAIYRTPPAVVARAHATPYSCCHTCFKRLPPLARYLCTLAAARLVAMDAFAAACACALGHSSTAAREFQVEPTATQAPASCPHFPPKLLLSNHHCRTTELR
jgi:hypothetical protein